MLSESPRGGAGWSVEANIAAAATGLPWASMSDAAGSLIPGSLMNVTAVMNTRITAAPIVQPTSSRVLPWIWAATRPRRALNLSVNQISRPSTPTNTTAAMIRISR